MQPPCGRAHVFRHGSGKGDDVVLGDFFDGVDARDIKGPALANVACGFRRNNAGSCHRFGCGHLSDSAAKLVEGPTAPRPGPTLFTEPTMDENDDTRSSPVASIANVSTRMVPKYKKMNASTE